MSTMTIFFLTGQIILLIQKCYSEREEDWLVKLIPQNYSRFTLPANLKIDIYVLATPSAITSINIKSMDFEIESEYQIWWADERLNLRNSKNLTAKLQNSKDESLEVELSDSSDMHQQLWKPRLLFTNCKKCDPSLVSAKNAKLSLDIYPHTIYAFIAYRKTMAFVCSFDLISYPFDIQECSINVDLPLGTFQNNLKLHFSITDDIDGLVEIPPEYKLLSRTVIICDKINVSSSSGSSNKPNERSKLCRKIIFRMRRNINSFIILTFIPSGLIVIISSLSFWLDPEMAAPRVAMGLTSLLTLATQFNIVQRELPPVSYIKALDIWMFFCMFFVFATLIEFTLSSYLRRKMKGQIQPQLQKNLFTSTAFKVKPSTKRKYVKNRFKKLRLPVALCCGCKNVDQIARIVFPIVFLIFNIVYWSVYITRYQN